MALELDGGAVVYQMRNQKPYYLLLESATSAFWGFPKGHIEGKESVIEAAKREIYEETGIRAEIDENFYDVLNYKVGSNDKRVTLFSSEVQKDVVLRLQREEISAAGWFDYTTAREKLTYLNLKQTLERVNQYVEKIKG
ncbi:bis(5'-nucleosyl)-tetraphosphatase [Pediococcus stilesii]|uniref:Bis(5'-nucleosyl)-tetraphosphatase [asymmetrical] n=1 Tax=Pediococcus stilesii TaxID=331679 RepID=A0A0R2L3W9_9LACO|nr:NUDIX domain-containing protein [Pediococcus stilesii]KRN93549.1 NUDIX family hydrolase [Pediococcus stilesii]